MWRDYLSVTVYMSLQCCNVNYDIVLKRKLFIKRSQTDLASDVRGSLGPKLKRKRKPYLTYQHGCGLNHWQHRASKMLAVLVYHASLVRRMICRHAGMGAVRKPVTNALPGLRPKATWYLYNIILVKSVIYTRFSVKSKTTWDKAFDRTNIVALDSPRTTLSISRYNAYSNKKS